MTVAEAKAHFSECVRSATEGEEVVITRYGRPVAAVVSVDELDRLRRLRSGKSRGGLAALAELEDMEGFSEELDRVVEMRGPPRAVASFE